jgi:hypothetical protein
MLLFLCLMAGDVRFARRYGSPATIHKPRDFVFGWIFSLPLFPLPKTHFARAMIPPAWGPGRLFDAVGAVTVTVTMLPVGAEKRAFEGDTRKRGYFVDVDGYIAGAPQRQGGREFPNLAMIAH